MGILGTPWGHPQGNSSISTTILHQPQRYIDLALRRVINFCKESLSVISLWSYLRVQCKLFKKAFSFRNIKLIDNQGFLINISQICKGCTLAWDYYALCIFSPAILDWLWTLNSKLQSLFNKVLQWAFWYSARHIRHLWTDIEL